MVGGLLALYDRTGDESQLVSARATVDRTERLVAGLVDILDQDLMIEAPVPVDLDPVITVARQGSVPVDVTFENGVAPTVLGDARRLTELFYHVFQNSTIHRTAGTDRVAVRIGSFEGGLYVEDDGPGVPHPIRDLVLELGFTTDENRAGVGLTAIQRLAAAHDWTVRVASSTTGGTRLEFTGVTLVD